MPLAGNRAGHKGILTATEATGDATSSNERYLCLLLFQGWQVRIGQPDLGLSSR